MKTKAQLRAEFPELSEVQVGTCYQYLEIIAPKGASDPEFRELVASSIEENGNLLQLTKTLNLPLEVWGIAEHSQTIKEPLRGNNN